MMLGRLNISLGFIVFISIFYYFDSGNLLPYILSAILVHESGHILAIWTFDAKIEGIDAGAAGVNIRIADSPMLSYGQEVITALSGAFANGIAALLSSLLGRFTGGSEPLFVFAGVNLILCFFNLLPIPEMDGGKALYLMLALLTDRPAAAYKISRAIGFSTLIFIFASGVLIFVISGYKNISMCLVSIYLLSKQMRGQGLKNLPKDVKKGKMESA